MKLNLPILLILLALVFSALSHGLYLRVQYKLDDFYKCFKQAGNDNIMLGYADDPDKESVTDIISAKNQGLNVDIFLQYCRSDNIESFVRKMREYFGTHILSQVWLFQYQGGQQVKCNWENYDQKQNCQYLQDLISTLKKYGFNGNVGTNLRSWTLIFGSAEACPQVANSLLWWLPEQEQQSYQPDFKYYRKIGGWKIPYMKLYDRPLICGESTSRSYYQ